MGLSHATPTHSKSCTRKKQQLADTKIKNLKKTREVSGKQYRSFSSILSIFYTSLLMIPPLSFLLFSVQSYILQLSTPNLNPYKFLLEISYIFLLQFWKRQFLFLAGINIYYYNNRVIVGDGSAARRPDSRSTCCRRRDSTVNSDAISDENLPDRRRPFHWWRHFMERRWIYLRSLESNRLRSRFAPSLLQTQQFLLLRSPTQHLCK